MTRENAVTRDRDYLIVFLLFMIVLGLGVIMQQLSEISHQLAYIVIK